MCCTGRAAVIIMELKTRELYLNHLQKRLPTVRSLIQWLQEEAEVWPLLERLAMPAVKMGLRTVDQLQRLAPRLVRLDMTMVLRHCDEMLPFGSETLQEICFPCGSKMTDAGLCATLNQLPELRVLELPDCNYISNVCIEHAMAACPHLHKLTLSKCTWVDGQTLRYLGGSRVRGSTLSEQPLSQWVSSIGTKKKRLNHAPRQVTSAAPVQWLNLTQCRALCDASLLHLFGSLRALSLCGCTVLTDVAARNVAAHCPQLRLLDLSWAGLTDAGLAAVLRGCRQLQFLGAAHCTQLTDAGIRAVRPSSATAELHQLSLRSCPALTAATATELATWPMLQKLDVGGLTVPPGTFAGWTESRCQQFCRAQPAPASPAPSVPPAAPAAPARDSRKRTLEELLDAWDDSDTPS